MLTNLVVLVQATYYGNNGWAGSCMGEIRWANGRYNAAAWPPSGGQFGTRVALNSRQYSQNMCGKKLMFRGTGKGIGNSPVSTSWQRGMVTNLCPECQHGDLDIGSGGDGRCLSFLSVPFVPLSTFVPSSPFISSSLGLWCHQSIACTSLLCGCAFTRSARWP